MFVTTEFDCITKRIGRCHRGVHFGSASLKRAEERCKFLPYFFLIKALTKTEVLGSMILRLDHIAVLPEGRLEISLSLVTRPVEYCFYHRAFIDTNI